MGLDINSIFGGASNTADQGMKDALQAGANSALGFLEGKAISFLQADQTDSNAKAQQAVTSILQSPSNPNGFGAYFSGLVQNPALNTYGPYLIAAVVGVAVVTYFVMKR